MLSILKKRQGLKLDKRHLKHANMSLTFQASSDQLFQGRFLSIYCEDSETTDHIPDHSWQPKGLKFTSCRWSFLMWSWVQQLQAPTSHSQVPKIFREKERLGRANCGPSGSFVSRDGHILIQMTLHHSRIPIFEQSLSNMKGQKPQCLKALKSFIKRQATRTREETNIRKGSFAEQRKLRKWWGTF